MKQKIAIIGAGIAGLSLAWYFKRKWKNNLDIILIEKSDRVGGLIRTDSTDKHHFERGPHSFRSQGAGRHIIDLLHDLNLQDAIVRADSVSRKRYIINEKKVTELPSQLWHICSQPLGRKIIQSIIHELIYGRRCTSDISVGEYFTNRFGKSFTETFIGPLVAGIWSSNPYHISMEMCFPALFSHTQNKRLLLSYLIERGLSSILKPKRIDDRYDQVGTFSLIHGCEMLPQELIQQLDVDVEYDCGVCGLYENASSVEIATHGKTLSADYVFSCVPPHCAMEFVESKHPVRSHLGTIESGSIASVFLGYTNTCAKAQGFGFLCPMSEEEELLGCIYDSSIFPVHNKSLRTRLTFMFAGGRSKKTFYRDEEELVRMAKIAASRYLCLTNEPDYIRVHKTEKCIAQYPVGHTMNIQEIEKKTAGSRVQFLGAGLYGASVGECIQAARRLAEKFTL